MLPIQFFSQNAHFGINLLAALVFFAMFWLYIDAWSNKKPKKELFKWLGCLFLSLGFLANGVTIEESIFSASELGPWTRLISIIFQAVGYISLIYGQIIDPLQPVPEMKGLDEEPKQVDNAAAQTAPTPTVAPQPQPAVTQTKKAPAPQPSVPQPQQQPQASAQPQQPQVTKPKRQHPVLKSLQNDNETNNDRPHNYVIAGVGGGLGLTKAVLPIAAGVTAYLYWRRATTGLERHLKPVALGFLLLSIHSIFALGELFKNSDNPVVFKFVAPYGFLWWLSEVTLLLGVLILGKWVWQYLVKRILSQIFMIFTTMTVVIFLATTVSFSFLLVDSVQKDTLNSLENAAKSLKFAIESKKTETISSAEVVASTSGVAEAVVQKNHDELLSLVNGVLAEKKLSSLIITTPAGQVLLRAEDPSRWGDSISDDQLLPKAADGVVASDVTSREDVVAPLLFFKSAVPIRDNSDQIVGVVLASVTADTGFVDSIKEATDMDIAVYSGNVRSATTFVSQDGKSRLTGIKETTPAINDEVLSSGKTFKGVVSILNQPFLSVYTPLKDVNDKAAGMLFVGKPHTYVLETAGKSIQLTFVVAAILILLSILPAYVIAKHISRQVH